MDTTNKLNLDHLLGWRLLGGSHSTAGLGGGCINEVAWVAAGRAWERMTYDNLPEEFSAPISKFAMWMNDSMDDVQRQRLVPFVTRLYGISDTPEVESERLAVFEAYKKTIKASPPVHAFSGCGCPSCLLTDGQRRGDPTWDLAIAALETALAIGKQADPLDNYLVGERVSKARAATPEAPKASPTGGFGGGPFFMQKTTALPKSYWKPLLVDYPWDVGSTVTQAVWA